MVMLAIFARISHDAGARGESRGVTNGKRRVGGVWLVSPFGGTLIRGFWRSKNV